jgi:hypothetical protein
MKESSERKYAMPDDRAGYKNPLLISARRKKGTIFMFIGTSYVSGGNAPFPSNWLSFLPFPKLTAN